MCQKDNPIIQVYPYNDCILFLDNFALFQNVTSSSTASGNGIDVTDGDIGTCFATNTDAVAWLIVHLETERFVTGVAILTSAKYFCIIHHSVFMFFSVNCFRWHSFFD